MHVVAAAVTAPDGRILIAQRPPGKRLAGWWEFPGGKVEDGESPTAALARELNEELAIALSGPPRPLMRLRHTYPYGQVLLEVWVVTHYDGEPRGMDGQSIRWCTQEELETMVELLPADRPVAKALILPEKLEQAITQHFQVNWRLSNPMPQDDSAPGHKLQGLFCERVEEILPADGRNNRYGADFLVMRNRVASDQLQRICKIVDVPVYACGVPIETAIALGATGVSMLSTIAIE